MSLERPANAILQGRVDRDKHRVIVLSRAMIRRGDNRHSLVPERTVMSRRTNLRNISRTRHTSAKFGNSSRETGSITVICDCSKG
jgi:hypothetical protein